MNYANRNGTDAEASTQELLTNFAYAVGVSSSLSMGFRASFERASFMSDATRNVAKLVRQKFRFTSVVLPIDLFLEAFSDFL